MAAPESSTDPNKNIPEFEYIGVNTNAFHIGSFRSEWLNRLKPSDYSYQREDEDTFDANFAKETGISAETLADLKSICRQRKKRQDYRASLKSTKNRHDLYADELERLVGGRKPESVVDMVPEGEIILTINVYYPATYENFSAIRPHVTMLMTGSHSLAELRDAICCVSDLQVCGEFSNTPDMAPEFISKDHFKSAYFFFEGVFYNDMRYPECQDISMTVIEWAKARNFPPYSQAKMQDTRFVDMKVKVGFPYLYCHQGDCEHLVIITDIRLIHADDCLDKKLYPLLTNKHRVTTQKCAACHVFIGRWLTTNDRLAPSDPCLFCDKCFRMLHYDAQGKKIGAFLAYPYVDRGAFN
ncbi:snRNA-activating protein complex subunit 3 isoform X2 [Clinocottus analis]|uniref:snRNA-activating protein complex subunit 3 isoform X2 n=1 Tax=Clinocottus analis TaxID=304258 RepID=UPI0035C22411